MQLLDIFKIRKIFNERITFIFVRLPFPYLITFHFNPDSPD